MKSNGEQFVDLMRRMGAKVPEGRPTESELEVLRDYLQSRAGEHQICDNFSRFLSEIIRSTRYEACNVIVFGTDNFIATQRNSAVAELPADSGLVMFAVWDGDSGGDSWVLDLKYNCIRCVPAILMGVMPMSEVRAYAYGCFRDPEGFLAYMTGVAAQRGWVKH